MAAELFTKTAAKILDIKLTFSVGVERYKADKTKDWIGFHSSIDYGSVDRLTDLLFGHLGM